ncbi:MAG: SRPBCC family protein [Rhizobiales bacterium]|nr:SRPBCC family protein [Hyphomicrobiales bacterium]
MTNLSVIHKSIADPATCWTLLSDFGNIDVFNPGVAKSYLLNGTQNAGVGATRQCDLTDGKNFLRERITDWQEGKSYTVSIYEGSVPIKDTQVRLSIEPDGTGSILKMDMSYRPKFGLLGAVMDVLMLKRMMAKSMRSVVAGLDEKATIEMQRAA